MKKFYCMVILFACIAVSVIGQVGINTLGSQPHPSAILEARSTEKGFLPPRMTFAEMNAISTPAPGLMVYCTDCGANGSGRMAVFMNGMWFILKYNCPAVGSPVTGVHTPSSYQITWNWNAVAVATGYKWNTVNDYNTATDMFAATTKTETGLSCITSYTRYVWAYSACGFSTAAILSQTTSACFTCGASITINHVAGETAPVTKTATYGTVTNIPGETSKCWITSNLGADRQATSVDDDTEPSAGWYWQFNLKQGYKHDGTTRTPATTWITAINENSDWISTNDPCAIELGGGWRIPTYTEWNNVDATGNWTDLNGPWNSGLKMHAAGSLFANDGSLQLPGYWGNYWSSTQSGNLWGWIIYFDSDYWGGCYMQENAKANGATLRCVQNQ